MSKCVRWCVIAEMNRCQFVQNLAVAAFLPYYLRAQGKKNVLKKRHHP